MMSFGDEFVLLKGAVGHVFYPLNHAIGGGFDVCLVADSGSELHENGINLFQSLAAGCDKAYQNQSYLSPRRREMDGTHFLDSRSRRNRPRRNLKGHPKSAWGELHQHCGLCLAQDLQKTKNQTQRIGPTLCNAMPPAKTVRKVPLHSPVAPNDPPKCLYRSGAI